MALASYVHFLRCYPQKMERFGKYQVSEKIGEGGFGVIYRGFDPLIKRAVAIKTCTSEEEEVRRRFFQEAEIAGNLHHRNITIVFDFGVEQGVPYLVQEYLTGEDLRRKIRRRDSIPYGTKLLYLIQVVRGLQHAHSKGVIHRDIKPSNIRILDDNTVKIMDFGIAKVQSLNRTLTQTGETLGTAAYLSPEQIRGEPLDPRADIFSFGSMAYELLTGQRAFRGDTPSAVLYQVLSHEPTKIRELWRDCPPSIERIVLRCLAKDREDRYSTCSELFADLTAIAREVEGAELDASPDASKAQREMEEGDTIKLSGAPTQSGRTLGDLTLDRHSATQHPVIRRRRLISVLLTVAGMAGLAMAAWWYLQGYRPLGVAPGTQVVASAPEVKANPEGSVQSKRENEATATNADEPDDFVGPPAPLDLTGQEADGGTERATGGSDEAEVVVPDLEIAVLYVRPGFSPDVQVEIDGGQALRLGTGVQIELAPGTHTVRFSYNGEQHQESTETVAELVAGERLALSVPLREPAYLTIRQRPGSRRGFVLLGGAPVGWTPIQEHIVSPGNYQVLIKDSPEQDGGTVLDTVELRAGHASIVTFDLEDSAPPVVTQREKTEDPAASR